MLWLFFSPSFTFSTQSSGVLQHSGPIRTVLAQILRFLLKATAKSKQIQYTSSGLAYTFRSKGNCEMAGGELTHCKESSLVSFARRNIPTGWPGWPELTKSWVKRTTWKINSLLNKVLDGLFSGKGYLVKGAEQSWLVAEIAFWVIKMILFQLVHHGHGKYHNFGHNLPLPLHTIFNLKNNNNNNLLCFQAYLGTFSPQPSISALLFHHSGWARVDYSYLVLPNPEARLQSNSQRYLLSVFLPTDSRIERKEQHFVSEGMKIKNSV